MFYTHTCGELNIKNAGQKVTLCGWVQRSRDLGGMTFIDLRDRYGIAQLVFNMEADKALCEKARSLGREYVISASGIVMERSNKNKNLPTGEIEIQVEKLEVLNPSKTPPFTIEDHSDGGDDLRLKYRYLDLRRTINKNNLIMRHQVARAVREYLDGQKFIDIETPFLIKSTPEGARDFVVPSRMNPGQFYALPQSPQTFKQLLMVAGFDRYYQLVRCFRDEDLRADRQPEFTQIDCEMAFVEQEDVLQMFEGMVKHVFRKVKNTELPVFPVMKYEDAMRLYGCDKPDLRFGMPIIELNDIIKGKSFKVFDDAEMIGGICVSGASEYTRKQLDDLTDFVKRPQVGAAGMVYIRHLPDGSFKSSVDKFYNAADLEKICTHTGAAEGSLLLILAGNKNKTRSALSALRLEMGARLGLRKKEDYKPLWITDFPLLEYNEEDKRYYAMHHPFTSPRPEDIPLLQENRDLSKIKASAYDLVINGTEIGGGSIRIHNRRLQESMFRAIGLSKEEAEQKFAFILNAFEYGAPPHGGIAFGFDRFCSMMIANEDYIREFIAFPKNNAGRDMMLDAPSEITAEQLRELSLETKREK